MVRVPQKAVSWFRNSFTQYGELRVPATVKRDLVVKEVIPGATNPVSRSFFVQAPGERAREAVMQLGDKLKLGRAELVQTSGQARMGQVLDMTPAVTFTPGDVVGRGNGVMLDTMAQGGVAVTVEEFLKTGQWKLHKADIGHVGIVGVDAQGKMGVYEIFVGHVEPALEKLLPKNVRRKPHTFVRFVSLDQFFNSVPKGFMRTTMVVRPEDPGVGARAAARAKALFDSQVSPDGKRSYGWFIKANRHLDRSVKDRSGPCSGFVNTAYGWKLNRLLGIPVSPEAIMDTSKMKVVGYKTIETIKPSADAVFRF